MLVTTREPVRHRAGDYAPKHRAEGAVDLTSTADLPYDAPVLLDGTVIGRHRATR